MNAGAGDTNSVPAREVLKKAVFLAGRAPSLHNSQPWRWVFDGTALRLYAVPRRLPPTADPTGRRLLFNCGIVLHHLRVAMTAAGWHTTLACFPNPNDHDHLVTLRFEPARFVTTADHARADAMTRRRTDRLPFDAPKGWETFEPMLRSTIVLTDAMLDILPEDSRPALAQASELTAAGRRYDADYAAESQLWTGRSAAAAQSLIAASEDAPGDASDTYPPASDQSRQRELGIDRSEILALSTADDSADTLLRCGAALSVVLLECTVAGYHTCALTQVTELPRSRKIVTDLLGRNVLPQVLIRVGSAPHDADEPAPTPRLPLAAILEVTGRPRH